MQTLSINPSPEKASNLRLALSKSREHGSYKFNCDHKEYTLFFDKQRSNSRYYDLIVRQDDQTIINLHTSLTRGDIIKKYFQEEIIAEKSKPEHVGINEEIVFIQING